MPSWVLYSVNPSVDDFQPEPEKSLELQDWRCGRAPNGKLPVPSGVPNDPDLLPRVLPLGLPVCCVGVGVLRSF